MGRTNKNILALNGGSSSIKFSVYSMEAVPVRSLSGKIERIGLPDTKLTYKYDRKEAAGSTGYDDAGGGGEVAVQAADIGQAAVFLLHWLQEQEGGEMPVAVGHRIVHGMQHKAAVVVDAALLGELEKISVYDPDHLPGEIALIRLLMQQAPDLPQILCFDTAFHATLPRLAKVLPIPRRLDDAGIQRYGFHGLSYTYVLEELFKVASAEVADGSVILAHLGNGASLAAVREGRSIDTTMGFTPTGGIMMGTRPGDLDPGVIGYLLQQEKLTPEQLSHMVNHDSGLLGVSGSSSDMQDLLSKESSDIRAAEAIALFCYQIKKTIGAYAAVLGGVDALVFTGGIGEKSSIIRSRICAGLEYLGIELDQHRNAANERLIALAGSKTGVYVIPTNEEWVIARTVYRVMNRSQS